MSEICAQCGSDRTPEAIRRPIPVKLAINVWKSDGYEHTSSSADFSIAWICEHCGNHNREQK